MLNYLENYRGSVNVNGTDYSTVKHALRALNGYIGPVVVLLGNTQQAEPHENPQPQVGSNDGTVYQIKVRQYMTKPATIDFDFHDKWNKGVPMPMRIMVGRKLKETKGMVQMELWGEIVGEQMTACMKCGRTLTNPVSRYFGIGPECGSHHHVNPFDSDEALQEAVAEVQQQLQEVKWTGWIIKSAIETEQIIRR